MNNIKFKFVLISIFLVFAIGVQVSAEQEPAQQNQLDEVSVIEEIKIPEENVGNENTTPTTTPDIDLDISTSTDETDDSSSMMAFMNSEISSEIKLIIKKNSQIILDQNVEISDESIDFVASGESKTVARNTVLGMLLFADSMSDAFNFTDIDYYSFFDSYLINCINAPAVDVNDLCYDWQYVVNGEYPAFGADKYILNEGDTVYFYFGKSKKITVPNEIFVNQEFSVLAEGYDYVNDAWEKIQNTVLGVVKLEGWDTTEIATSTTDVDGFAKFTVINEDMYKVGFQEDYYYPSYDLVFGTTTATSTPTTIPVVSTSTTQTDGGSGGSSKNTFNLNKAIDFILANQNSNGSFGGDLYTDWVAVGLGANNRDNSQIKSYLKSDKISNELTEYLRRSMALMSVGLDPQKDYKEFNLVEKIIDEFDGEQFGDSDLVNDDIFAILVLSNLGYEYEDFEIKNTIDFILSRQSGNGSWEGIDLTSAGIQALSNFENESKVSSSINKAKNYLENEKQSNGSWEDNVFSTAWAIMAVNSLGENSDSFGNSKDPYEYLGEKQDLDGGLLSDDSLSNRIWSTAYAIASASNQDWNDIMSNFNKLETDENSNNSSGVNDSNEEVENSDENQNEEEILETEQETEIQNVSDDTFLIANSFVKPTENVSAQGGEQETEEVQENPQIKLEEIENMANVSGIFDISAWWYLAGAVFFALIALLNFKK